MDIVAAGVSEGPGYDRQERLYRQRVAARYAALREARADRARLVALRRAARGAHGPRPNRRPAMLLAVLFVALIVGLACVARASGGEREKSRIRSAICSVFAGQRCGPAIRVATCETGGTLYPRSLGSAGERGLFQIHPVHFRTFSRARLFEVLYNIRAAFRLSRGGRDWSPWTCRP